MRARRRERILPNFEAASLALFAFAALAVQVPPARAQAAFGGSPTVKQASARSAASAPTSTRVVTPPRSAASSPKR